MTRRLRWTEQAIHQLGGIAEYISLSSPVYADQVVERINARLQQALEFPDSGGIVRERESPELRKLIECPYRIIYRPRGDIIEVVAVCTADGISAKLISARVGVATG